MKFWNPCYRSENKKSSLLLRLCFYNFQQLNSYLATNDQPQQAEIAEKLLKSNEVFISRTVLLETEWVLRSRYKVKATQISGFISALLNQDTIVIENDQQIEQALKWYDLGADFSDALHLAVCDSAPLYTFDKDFCKTAR